ncbi:MAG: hypothetical protein AB1512_22040 [Thermodesulfobacteriota bacterium]
MSALYPSKREFADFEKRYGRFHQSDESTHAVYELNGKTLKYRSEQLIPSRNDGRPALLLIFGNPASRSVVAGCFFAFKGGRENGFWKHLLGRAGVLKFSPQEGALRKDQNCVRTKQILSLEYNSPFRIGLCVYVSMPSPAGGPWSGVAGIRKLLGSSAFEHIEACETERILHVAKRFLAGRGLAVTFQRNAWEGLRSENDPHYSIEKAREAKLRGSLKGMPHVRLLGVPPTRLLGPARDVLHKLLSLEGYRLMM